MKEYSDEELVRLYVETQRNEYFERLYERYCDKVYRKCLSFSKDPVQAEDYTHDVFLKLVTKLSSFREQAKFSTWLYSLTYNYCMDQVRSPRSKREVYVDEGWDRLNVAGDDEGMGEIADLEGTTESAIKMRLKRSRDKLRKIYLESAIFWLLLAIKAALSIRWPFR